MRRKNSLFLIGFFEISRQIVDGVGKTLIDERASADLKFQRKLIDLSQKLCGNPDGNGFFLIIFWNKGGHPAHLSFYFTAQGF